LLVRPFQPGCRAGSRLSLVINLVASIAPLNGEDGYLLFISRPTGYELRERQGDPPAVGDVVEEDDGRLRVSKLAPSPLPGDTRRCAYLQPVT
jgi:hypothetical protein